LKPAKGELHAVALTRGGAATAARLAESLGATLHLPERIASGFAGSSPFAEPFAALLARLWAKGNGLMLVMAAGIAVRASAPLLKSKYEDPALVVLDPGGLFCVSLLSGHLGGANDLAREAARITGGQAVITTATDAAGVVAVEVWAADVGLAIENPGMVAAVNGALADGEPVALYIDPELASPSAVVALAPHLALETTDLGEFEAAGGARIALTHRYPGPSGALLLRPRVLALGAGARKGANSLDAPGEMVRALRLAGYSELSAAHLSTIDLKENEEALNALADLLGVGMITFDSEALNSVATPNPSERVRKAVGAPAVAEASAILASCGGKLLMEKTAGRDWTLAAALIKGCGR